MLNLFAVVSNIKNLTWGKNDQHIKIYLPCNFEVNPIAHFGVISQRRRFLKKFTTYDDDGRQVMAIAHMTLWVR
jgi:hypothetical protein